MRKTEIIIENFEIAYEILKYIIDESVFSPYFSAYIDEDGILTILKDTRLEEIEIYRREKIVVATTFKYEIRELIAQLYPGSDDKIPLEPKWEDKDFQEEMIKTFPKAFSHYLKMRDTAKKLSDELGVDLEVIIDRDGLCYTRLLFKLKRWDYNSVLEKIREITSIYEEYYKRLGRLDSTHVDYFYRKQASKEMDEIYEITKPILQHLLKSKRQLKWIATSNHDPELIEIVIETGYEFNDEIKIEKTNNKYRIHLQINDKQIREEILKSNEFLEEKEGATLKLKHAIQNKLELKEWLQKKLPMFI